MIDFLSSMPVQRVLWACLYGLPAGIAALVAIWLFYRHRRHLCLEAHRAAERHTLSLIGVGHGHPHEAALPGTRQQTHQALR